MTKPLLLHTSTGNPSDSTTTGMTATFQLFYHALVVSSVAVSNACHAYGKQQVLHHIHSSGNMIHSFVAM